MIAIRQIFESWKFKHIPNYENYLIVLFVRWKILSGAYKSIGSVFWTEYKNATFLLKMLALNVKMPCC